MIDAATQAWIRNKSDEAAAANGCTFDVERAVFVVNWIESVCRLYEGEWAGQPLILRGCLDCGYDLQGVDGAERARRHCECVAAGHQVDWQYECVMRLFGWVRWSEKWKRLIRRFVQASIWVCKKNKKTPTLAAIGLYLLAGDGEQGQKVFLAAKNGKQARELAGKHIIEMVRACPDLAPPDGECTINQSTKQVTHEESRSILVPLSSENTRTQQANEGLNGSVLIDETHVVDRDFIGRISRAGISRSEPLQIEVSTAGDDQDGYGKERFDRAVAVMNGIFDEQELFAAVYAAPQDLNDADLDADPLKYGRMANPAMGHTVEAEEFLRDYRTSRAKSLYDFLLFKKYRLNVWSHSANPWLEAGDWQASQQQYGETDLEGMECYAGLDLSRVWDMSALVLCFPWAKGEYRLLSYFWLPRETAERKSDVVPFTQWAKEGLLTLTPGDDIDYGFIKGTIRKLAKRFKIRKLRYDPTYANELTQSLEQGQTDETGKAIEQGIAGLVREPFLQTLMNFTVPTKDFERLLKAKKLHHNGHKILTWQSGHVHVYRDSNGNIRPVKPKDGVKKIDGIVAAIQALSGAMDKTTTPAPTYYLKNELEVLSW